MRRREPKMSEGRHAALSTSVLRTLKKRIVAWEYPPDYRLVEERLCAEFGVSRSPVREALRVLASSGFLNKLPNRGYAVRQLKVRDAEELYEVRLALELYVVEYLAAGGAPAAMTGELRRTWSSLLRGAHRKSEELAVLDASFHETLARATNNKVLVAYLQAINERLLVFRMIDFEMPDRARGTCEQHLQILERIVAGDCRGARRAMQRNIDEARNHVRSALKDALAKAFAAES
jgi:DNA-binding GntR family transcriptional regulator